MTAGLNPRTWLIVGWPAFLVAGVLEMVVFAMVDPADLHTFGGGRIDLSPQAIYTLAFFVFWVATAVAGALTLMLARPAEDINRPV